MSLQVANVLECCRGVQLDNIAVNSGKEMAAITERTLQRKSQQIIFSTALKVISHVIFARKIKKR